MRKNGCDVFAPKGLLRMLILKIASMKPVTGIEIMQDVPEMTNNTWMPSPGSVYYLLGEMEQDGLLIHVPTGESGVKRYISSEKGKLSLDYFKLDAHKNLFRQIAMLKLLSDLTENKSLSQEIQNLSKRLTY